MNTTSRIGLFCSSALQFTLILLLLFGVFLETQNQSIIYSITRFNLSKEQKLTTLPTITTTTTLSTLQKNDLQNATSVLQGSSDFRIHVRSKRFMSKMPQMPASMQHPNGTGVLSADRKDSSKNISLVLADLLDDYDYNQRPGYGGLPAVITTNLEIRSMGPISELHMYSLDCYFRQKWLDERLRFTGSADSLSLNIKMLDRIWKPDTYFHTGKGSHLHTITTPNKFLRIKKNGFILYSMRLTIKSRCPMNLLNFPMDKQSCPLILGSYGYPNDQLVYQWDENPVTFNSRDFALSQFDIVKTISRNGTYSFRRGNHSMLQVNFNLRRHVGYFLIQIYVPCSLIVVLSWVSFWINREATADRVGLGVTAVLTLSTFGLDSRSDLPRVSYATALDWYTIICFLFVVSTLLQFSAVHFFTKVGTGEVPFIEIDSNSSSDDEGEFDTVQPQERWRSAANRLRQKRFRRQPIRSKRLPGRVKFARSTPPPFAVEYNMHNQNGSKNSTLHSNDHSKLWTMGNNHPEVVQAHIDQLHSPESSEYQQYLRCWVGDQHLEEMDKGALEPINDQVSYLENYVTKRLRHNHSNLLKQTSSWPKLVLSDMTEHSEANLPWSMTDLTEACGFDDGSNLEEDESLEDLENQSLNFWIKARLCLVQFWYCFSANEKYKQEMRRRRSHGKGLPAVNSVSKIDKVSRIMFPLIFFILNVIYWSFYIRERSIEFNQEDMADINLS